MWARGNNKQAIYLDDDDRLDYLDRLRRTVVWKGWRCLAYCLMDNHLHLVVETPAPNLGRGVQWLHGSYADGFNKRHGRVGHVFQGRFGSKLFKTDAQMLMAISYVANNPVAAGLCATAQEWPWGSHAAIVGGSVPGWLDVERVVEWFGGLERYIAFVGRDVA